MAALGGILKNLVISIVLALLLAALPVSAVFSNASDSDISAGGGSLGNNGAAKSGYDADDKLVLASALVDIEIVHETDLSDVLYALAYNAGADIVINAEMNTTVKASIHGANLYDVLDAMAVANNFNYRIIGKTIVIGPVETTTDTGNFHLRYTNPEDAKKVWLSFINEGKIGIDVERSVIIVDGTRQQLQKVAKILADIDKPTRQILLQVKLLEMDIGDELKLGLSYTMPAVVGKGVVNPFSIAGSTFTWGIASSASDVLSNAKVLTNPSLVVLNGREATVKMVENYPIFSATVTTGGAVQQEVAYKDIGVTFIATARVDFNSGNDERVTMKVHPIISTYLQSVKNQQMEAPLIANREAETMVRVKSGETIVIGGLVADQDTTSVTSVPFLSSIPLLGGLFKYDDHKKKKTDLCILVTPIVLDEDGKIPASVAEQLQQNGQINNSATSKPASGMQDHVDKLINEVGGGN